MKTLAILLSAFFLFSCPKKAEQYDIFIKDKTIPSESISNLLLEKEEHFQFHLRVVEPDKSLDTEILKKIENSERYKIIAIDPKRKIINKEVTEMLNNSLNSFPLK